MLGGFLILIIGAMYIALEKSLLVRTMPTSEGLGSPRADTISRLILGVQVSAVRDLFPCALLMRCAIRLGWSRLLCWSLGRVSLLCKRSRDFRSARRLLGGLHLVSVHFLLVPQTSRQSNGILSSHIYDLYRITSSHLRHNSQFVTGVRRRAYDRFGTCRIPCQFTSTSMKGSKAFRNAAR